MNKTPKLYGLVLAGGDSERMGEDKGLLAYHGIPQREYLAQLVAPFCKKVFVSITKAQVHDYASAFPQLLDSGKEKTPLNGIRTAFKHRDTVAWLVIACDMPLVDEECLEYLINNRNTEKNATCFWNETRQHIEPLLSIWEPSAGLLLKDYQQKSPLRFLNQVDTHLVNPLSSEHLANINFPKEKTFIEKLLGA